MKITTKNASKYTHVEAVAFLCNMQIHGQRKYRPGGIYGRLPTPNYVRSWFSIRKRKGAKAHATAHPDDKFHGMSIETLKDIFLGTFGLSATPKHVLAKMLEIDDHLQDGGHDDEYSSLKNADLVKECKARSQEESQHL